MANHELKTHPGPFQAVIAGKKRHEVRVNDRNYQEGDTVTLREWDPLTGEYTGSGWMFTIGHVSAGGTWGLPEGLCVFSLLPYPRPPEVKP